MNPLPLLCVLGWLGAAPGAAAAEDKGNSVAVLKMEAKKGVDPSTAELLSQSLTARVRATGRFHTVVGFTEIESLLGFERQKQLMQCEASSCMAEVAGAMGVRYLITTSVGRLGSATWLINASLVDTVTARAENAVTERVDGGDESALDGAVDRVVRKLLGAPVVAAPPPGAVKPAPTLPPSATPARPPRADGQKSWDDFGLDDALDRRKPAAQGGATPSTSPSPAPPPTAAPAPPPPAAAPPAAARPAPRPAPVAPAPPQAALEDDEDGEAQDGKNDKRTKKKSKRKAAREKAEADRPTPVTSYFFPYGFGGAVALGAAAVVTFLLWGPVTVGAAVGGVFIEGVPSPTFPLFTLVCGGIGFLCCGVVLGSMVAGIVALVAGSVRSVVTYVRQRVVDDGEKTAARPPARAHGVLVAADAEEL